MTPAEEPGRRPRDPDVARLLRWYPLAWRQRYGEEFLAMVEDGLDGQRPTWRLTGSVAWAGLRQRGRALISIRTLARRTREMNSVLCRWWSSCIAAVTLAALPAAVAASAPGGRAWQVTAALATLVAVTALTGLTVLAGGLVALPAFRRFLRAGGWAAIRRRIAWAAGATVVAGGALTGLGLASRSQTYTQLVNWPDYGWVAGTTLALMIALGLWASAANATARHLDLSPRERSAGAVLGALTLNGAFAMISATVLVNAAVESSLPTLLLAVASLATAAVRGRMQVRLAVGGASRRRRGSGTGRHVDRGG
jgi:hypothetical protein